MNYRLLFLNLIAIFAILLLNLYLQKYSVIIFDDFSEVPWINSIGFIKYKIMQSYHGNYLVGLFPGFVCGFFPAMTDIHAINWMNSGGNIFKTLFIITLCAGLAKFYFINKKINYLFPVFLLINYIYYYFLVRDTYVFQMFTSFFHNIFPFIIFLLFMYTLLKQILYNNKLVLGNYLILLLLVFLVGISNDFIKYTTFLILLSLFFFSKNINLKNKHILSFLFVLSIGIFLTFFGPQLHLSFEHYGYIRDIPTIINQTYKIWFDFTTKFFDIILHYFIYEIIIIFILFILNVRTIKNNSFLKFYPLCLFFSGFLFYYALIFLGDADFGGIVRLTHPDIIYEIKIYLLFIIYFQAGILCSQSKLLIKRFFISIFIYLCIHSSIYLIFQFKNIEQPFNYNHHTNSLKKDFYFRYKIERIWLYFLLVERNTFVLTEYSPDPEQHFYVAQSYFESEYKYLEDNISICLEKEPIYFDTYDELYNYYLSIGGPEFQKEDYENPDFQRLKDINYILHGIKTDKWIQK